MRALLAFALVAALSGCAAPPAPDHEAEVVEVARVGSPRLVARLYESKPDGTRSRTKGYDPTVSSRVRKILDDLGITAGGVYTPSSGGDDIQTDQTGVGSLTQAAGKVILAGNGTAGAPSFSFASDTNTGMYRVTSDIIGFAGGGSLIVTADNGAGVILATGYVLGFSPSSAANSPDVGLFRTGAGALKVTDGGGSNPASLTMLGLTTSGNTTLGDAVGDHTTIAGDIALASASVGTSGQVLTTGGAGAACTWTTVSGTGVGAGGVIASSSTSYTLAQGTDAGKTVVFSGGGASYSVTLPTCSAGAGPFTVVDFDASRTLHLIAATGDNIYMGGTPTATAGYLSTGAGGGTVANIGWHLTVVGLDATSWLVIAWDGQVFGYSAD